MGMGKSTASSLQGEFHGRSHNRLAWPMEGVGREGVGRGGVGGFGALLLGRICEADT